MKAVNRFMSDRMVAVSNGQYSLKAKKLVAN